MLCSTNKTSTEKEALFGSGTHRMTEEVLEPYVKKYIEAQPVPEINFAWQGGEPPLQASISLEKQWRKLRLQSEVYRRRLNDEKHKSN